MTAAWQLDLRVTEKIVLLCLADNANDEGKCWPSITTLCKKCSLTDRGIQKAIARLIERKLIARTERRGRSNIYYLTNLRTVFTPNDIHPTPEPHSPSPPNTVPPEPSIEPKENHQKSLRELDGVKPHNGPFNEAVETWNKAAERLDLSKVQNLTGSRQAKLRARLSDCGGLDGWCSALEKIAASPFLLGHNARGWKGSFDWLLQENSFTKLMENAYEPSSKNQQHSGRSEAGKPSSYERAILAGVTGSR